MRKFFQTEYNCEDATCISPLLRCNGIRNCKFGWDEEACADTTSQFMVLFGSTHVISILIVLTIILIGMMAGMVWNFLRIINDDKEELAASREKSLGGAASASLGKPASGDASEAADLERNAIPHPPPPPPTSSSAPPPPPPPPPGPPGDSHHSPRQHRHRHHHRSGQNAAPPPVPTGKSASSGMSDSNGGCYVPDGGFPLSSAASAAARI